ncbi:magnesium transporter [Flexibacterium corallicola]|uniref:magnesium transporter n=1 Tax=Flexibacterium corallicola TaxID=3037259 RepID=UPI00286F1E2A|nr:magnesium transporter [Pseudovibrio sp. M1P-2-3]
MNSSPEQIRTAEGRLASGFVREVEQAISAKNKERVIELAGSLHEADLGELIEYLHSNDRIALVSLLGDAFDFTALTEVDEPIRNRLIEAMPDQEIADGISELESDDAVQILEDLDQQEQEKILSQLPSVDRVQLRRALEYPEDTAGRLVQTDFVAVPPFWSVGQVIDHLRASEDLPERFYAIYIVDPGFRLLGSIPLDRILTTPRSTKVSQIVEEARHLVRVTDDQEEVARLFERYNLVSVAVADDSDRLVGIISIDDIVDVIQEEVEEDMLAMAGVGDEEISDSVFEIAKLRIGWLVVNVFTALLAASVISLFEDTIELMVALAVLMPIVASVGGNLGTQTMTVSVRAIATQDLGRRNLLRVLRRETLVGGVNGLAVGLLVGIIASAWFQDHNIGLVIGAAVFVNGVCAGLFGLLIPYTLERLRVDPAIASSVFVTTVTDVVGFFSFLGLAAWWFQLPM